MRALIALSALLAAAGAQPAQAQAALTPLWSLDGLADPESVALGPDGETLYVANVAGEGDAKDANGFISRVSRDGRMLEREWARGLDGPKGAVVGGGELLVSDITRLVAIDLATGEITRSHDVPGAGFLNDVAVTPQGEVLVADSASGRIFSLKDGAVAVWAEGPELRAVNGLLPEPGRLVVTTMAGKLLAFDYATRAVRVLAEGLGDADGVASLGEGRYLVSEWPGRLFEVAADGTARVLIDERAAPRYINDFILVGDELIVPHWKPGALSVYRVAR